MRIQQKHIRLEKKGKNASKELKVNENELIKAQRTNWKMMTDDGISHKL